MLVILLGLIGSPAAFGQATDANGKLISPIAFVNQEPVTTSFVPAPNVGSTSDSGGGSDVGQWLKVEFHYGTTTVMDAKYLDEVEFKIWIEGRDETAVNAQGTKGIAVAMTGSVTYVNVPAGKDLYGSFYVHPNTIGRYSSRDSEDFDRKFNIHVEAYVKGQLMDAVDKNKEKDPAWFKPLPVIANLVYRQDQCAFMMSDTSRYPAIKMATSGAAATP